MDQCVFLGRYKMKSRLLLPRKIRAEGYRGDDTTSDDGGDDDGNIPVLNEASSSSDDLDNANHGRTVVCHSDCFKNETKLFVR